MEKYKEDIRKVIYQNSYDDSYSINFENVEDVIDKISNLPIEEETDYTKQSVYNRIRLLVNTVPNDMILGEAVRKLFS
jgi:hypothetical protein